MKETIIYLPEETSLILEELANQLGRSQADLIREAIEGFLIRESQVLSRVRMGISCQDSTSAEELVNRRDLRLQLEEGAIRRAERDQNLAGDWFDLEEKAWLKSSK